MHTTPSHHALPLCQPSHTAVPRCGSCWLWALAPTTRPQGPRRCCRGGPPRGRKCLGGCLDVTYRHRLAAIALLPSPCCHRLTPTVSLPRPHCHREAAIASLPSPHCYRLTAIASLPSPHAHPLTAIASLPSPHCHRLTAIASLLSPYCHRLSPPHCHRLTAIASLPSPHCHRLTATASLPPPRVLCVPPCFGVRCGGCALHDGSLLSFCLCGGALRAAARPYSIILIHKQSLQCIEGCRP